MNTTRKLFITFACLTVFLIFLSGASAVYADASTGNDQNAPRGSITDMLTGGDTGTGILGGTLFKNVKNDPREIAREIIFIVFGFLGTLMICLILYSGFLWMTAHKSGEKDKVLTAKSYLTNAVVGAIIVMSAWTISIFVLNALKETVKDDSSAVDPSGGTSATVPTATPLLKIEDVCALACQGKWNGCVGMCTSACEDSGLRKNTSVCECHTNSNGLLGFGATGGCNSTW